MKCIFCLIAILALHLKSHAQEHAILTYKIEVPKEINAGDSVKLVVTLDIKPGFYIYAPTELNSMQGMQVTELRFAQLPAGLKRIGALKTPEPKQKGAYQVFSGEGIKFMQVFLASKDIPAGSFVVKGKLIWQACNDHICYPPVTEAFENTIKINL